MGRRTITISSLSEAQWRKQDALPVPDREVVPGQAARSPDNPKAPKTTKKKQLSPSKQRRKAAAEQALREALSARAKQLDQEPQVFVAEKEVDPPRPGSHHLLRQNPRRPGGGRR